MSRRVGALKISTFVSAATAMSEPSGLNATSPAPAGVKAAPFVAVLRSTDLARCRPVSTFHSNR